MSTKIDKGDVDVGNVVRAAAQNIFAHPEQASLKLVAWAYGCIKAGSEEESKLLRILRAKIADLPDLREQIDNRDMPADEPHPNHFLPGEGPEGSA
jgi:hypothetical protein